VEVEEGAYPAAAAAAAEGEKDRIRSHLACIASTLK
jgi:hypothetical protein